MISLFLKTFLFVKAIRAGILLLLPSILLEQPPASSAHLLKYRSFKFIFISLIFSGIVFTNLYKSIVTTDLTAPFSKNRLETFEEAVEQEYKIMPSFNPYMTESYNYTNTEEERVSAILNTSFFTESLKKEDECPNPSPRKQIKAQKILGQLRIPQGFPNVTFQMELSRCNKSIYVDNNYQLDQFRTEMLRYGRLKNTLYKGKESFLKELYSFSISNTEWDRTEMISRRMNSLSHSGIFKHLDGIYRIYEMKSRLNKFEQFYRKRKGIGSAHPQALNTSIISLFLIYLACVSICISVLIAEKMVTLFRKLLNKLSIINFIRPVDMV